MGVQVYIFLFKEWYFEIKVDKEVEKETPFFLIKKQIKVSFQVLIGLLEGFLTI